jgi:hypothetical protein
MSLTRKISLATLVIALGAGVTACHKKDAATEEPSAAEKMGVEAGQAQQSIEQGWDKTKDATTNAADAAAAKAEAASDKAKDAAADAKDAAKKATDDAKQSADEAKSDFKKGYDSTK